MTDDPFASLRGHITPPEIVAATGRYRQTVHSGEPLPIWNLDGISWSEASRTRWLHRHWPQTVGLDGPFIEVWRCPCGAIRLSGDRWRRA